MEREHGQWGKDLRGEWYLHSGFSAMLALSAWLDALMDEIEFEC